MGHDWTTLHMLVVAQAYEVLNKISEDPDEENMARACLVRRINCRFKGICRSWKKCRTNERAMHQQRTFCLIYDIQIGDHPRSMLVEFKLSFESASKIRKVVEADQVIDRWPVRSPWIWAYWTWVDR